MKNFTIISVVALFMLTVIEPVNAQLVISKPNLGFSQACASDSFNTYNVTFSFSPEEGVNSSNQFIIELSDATGSFLNPVAVYTSNAGTITVSPATLTFSVPTTIAGESFKIRIKSTDPIATSSNSDAFAAYYKIQDEPFTINNLIENGAFCSGGNYLLTIDNPGSGTNNSPLQYSFLTFNWYKETSSTTSVFVASGESLSVNQAGTYFVETNYGSCTSNSFSNRVTVSEANSSSTSSISSSRGNPFCASNGATVLSAINGESFQWYKDGEKIADATNQMYTTDESGVFSVDIDLGNCSTTSSIDLENIDFTSSIDLPEINVLDEGETLVATAITNAVNPVYKWYLNDILISGANSNSYEATEAGNYKVDITQTVGCIATTEIQFVVTESFPNVADIPNVISPNGDGVNDTWVIPQMYVSGTNTEVLVLSSQGEVVLQTSDYLNNWPQNQLKFKSVTPVYYYIITTQNNKVRKGSITVIK